MSDRPVGALDSVDTTGATVAVKPAVAKGKFLSPTLAGTQHLDTEAGKSILENMQRLIDEKEAQKSSFLERLKDAAAWTTGGVQGPTEGLALRGKAREEQTTDIYNMRMQLAQQRAAAEAAKQRQDVFYGTAPTGTTQAGTAPVGTTQAGGVQQFGGMLGRVQDPQYRNQLAELYRQNPDDAVKRVNDYLAKQAEPHELLRKRQELKAQGLSDEQINAILQVNIAGSGAYNPQDVRTPLGTVQNTPLGSVLRPPGAAAPAVAAPAVAAPAAVAAIGTPAPRVTPAQQISRDQGALNILENELKNSQNPQDKKDIQTEIDNLKKKIARNSAPAIPTPPAAATRFAPGSKEALVAQEKEEEAARLLRTQPELKAQDKLSEQEVEADKTSRQKYMAMDPITSMEKTNRISSNIELIRNNPRAVGVIAAPGLANGIFTLLDNGIRLGDMSAAVAGIEEALVRTMPGMDQKTIDARHQIASNLAHSKLLASQLAQGQGTVSDAERKMFAEMGGSVSLSPTALIKLQRMLLERAKMETELGALVRTLPTGTRMKDFEQSKEYLGVRDRYEANLKTAQSSPVVFNESAADKAKKDAWIQSPAGQKRLKEIQEGKK